jgi:hypothetical protein
MLTLLSIPNDARLKLKKVRKAEAMEAATAELLAFPETKMRRLDDAHLVKSEAEINASSSGLGSTERKSRDGRVAVGT